MRPEHIRELVEQALANIRMSHLTPAKCNGHLDLVAGVEKLRCLPTFSFKIVIIDLGPDPDLFELNDVLITSGLPFLPALLVSKFPVIHQPANGRNGIRRHFDEIKATFPRHIKRFASRHNSNLRALVINQPDLANPNPLVNASLNWSCYVVPP